MEALHCRSRLVASAPARTASACPLRARRSASSAIVSASPPVVAAAVTVVLAPPVTAAPVAPPAAPSATKPVRELDPDTFYDFVSTTDGLVVVDYYTDWCGPCQIMHKEVEKLTNAFKAIKFAKLNCSECQDFSTRQRIRALPTFRIYYRGRCLDELTGAKPVQLRQLLTHYSVMVPAAAGRSA